MMRAMATIVLMLLTLSAAAEEHVRRDLYGDPLPKDARMRLGTVRLRHGSSDLRSLAFSPDGRRLASGGKDHLIRLWDARTGAELLRLSGHGHTIRALSFSPDGKLLASAGDEDGTVRLWDAATGKLLRMLQHKKSVASVVFFPDGKSLVTSDYEERRIHFWDATSGECVRTLDGGEEIVCDLALSPDGKWLATGGSSRIRLWDVVSGKPVRTLQIKDRWLPCFCFSSDGTRLAAGSNWGWIFVWNLKTGEVIRKFHLEPKRDEAQWRGRRSLRSIRALVFTPDGRSLISGDDLAEIFSWDLAAKKEPRLLGQSSLMVSSLCLAPDGKTLASAGWDNLICLWDLTTGRRLIPAKGHDRSIAKLRFINDGRTLVSTDIGGTARTWDLTTRMERRCDVYFQGYFLDHILVAASLGERLIADGMEETIRVWELETKKARTTFETAGRAEVLSFAPDGKILAITTEKKEVEVWDVPARRRRCRVPGACYPTLSRDGRWLVAFDTEKFSSHNNRLHLWDTFSGKERWHIDADERKLRYPGRFSPDNRMLICHECRKDKEGKEGKRTLVVWEMRTGRERFRVEGYKGIYRASFSPDNRLLAYGEGDGTIRVLDVATGAERARFRSEQGEVNALAFSADGRTLASGGSDTTILLWPLPRSAQARPGKRLSAEEMSSLWADLAGSDATRAFRAMRMLYAAPESTLPYLRAHLRPVRIPDAERVQRLLADLDADTFAVREEASWQLAQMVEGAESLLRQALRKGASLDARRRIRRVLEQLVEDSPSRWRRARALEVLEWLDTWESRRLLEELAGGAADAWLTHEAQTSRNRLVRP